MRYNPDLTAKGSIIVLLWLLPLLGFAQKAYETASYKGYLRRRPVKLVLANGYAGASVISWFGAAKSKAVRFTPEDNAPGTQYIFRSDDASRKDYFTLNHIQEVYERLPKIITGYYRSAKHKERVDFYLRK